MIRIFCLDVEILNNKEIFQKYYFKMSKTRQNKIDCIKVNKARNLSLGAGILLDLALKEIGLNECDMLYGIKENGKPYFINRPDFYFNISHSDTKVILAFSDSEIGCDIEKIKNIGIDVAKRFFYKDEYEAILSADTDKDKNQTFFRLWTLKESFMKITGLGMKLPLDKFNIKLKNNIEVDCDIIDGDFNFYEFDDIEGYCVSCCYINESPKPVLEYKMIT